MMPTLTPAAQIAFRDDQFCAAINTLPDALAPVVMGVWEKIKNSVPGVLRVPYLDEREAGGVLLTWDKEAHHLDVEITLNGTLDYFYLNRETNEAWDVELSLDAPLPALVTARLNAFRVVA